MKTTKKMSKYQRQQIATKKKDMRALGRALIAVSNVASMFDSFRSARQNVVKQARDAIAGKHYQLTVELAGK